MQYQKDVFNMQTKLQKKSIFSKRLHEFLEETGFRSINEFSHYLGYKHSEKMNRLFREEDNKPSYDIIHDISMKFPALNMNWLLTGRGDMFLSKNALQVSESTSFLEADMKNYIPLYDLAATAGSSIKFWESEENILDLIPRKFGMRDCDIALHIYGDSMYPIYRAGDVVLLKEIWKRDLINYGQVYVIITEEHRFVKYVMRTKSRARIYAWIQKISITKVLK